MCPLSSCPPWPLTRQLCYDPMPLFVPFCSWISAVFDFFFWSNLRFGSVCYIESEYPTYLTKNVMIQTHTTSSNLRWNIPSESFLFHFVLEISIWMFWINRCPKIKLGANMPSRAELTARKSDCELQLIGEPTGEYYDVILYFGIIDILQDYDISKKLEHAYKSFQYDPTSISAVDPKQYSRRFRDFIYKAFQEDG